MVLGVGAVLFFLAQRSFTGFLVSFLALFATTGLGSTHRMIPTIFRTERERMVSEDNEGAVAEARRLGLKEGSFVLGFAGAIGACGGFIIPRLRGLRGGDGRAADRAL